MYLHTFLFSVFESYILSKFYYLTVFVCVCEKLPLALTYFPPRKETAHLGKRSLLDSIVFLISRSGHFLNLEVALAVMVVTGEPLLARTYGVMALMYFTVNKYLSHRLMGAAKDCFDFQVSGRRLQVRALMAAPHRFLTCPQTRVLKLSNTDKTA